MIRVDIPDKKTFVEFPDKTPPEIIEKTIRENFYNKPIRTGPLSQFQRIGDIYKEEVESGMGVMREAYEKPSGRTVLKGALGGLQYLASPLTAVARGAFREPIETIPRELGAPEIITKTIGEAAEQAAYVLPYGQMVRQAIKGGEVARKAGEAVKIGERATTIAEKATPKLKPPLKNVTEPTKELAEELSAAGKLNKPIIEETLQKKVANAAEEILTKSPPDEKKRIGQQIIELVHSEQINWKELPEILKKHNISPEEFSQRLKDTYSTAGRTLNRLSMIAKQVKKEIGKNPEAQKFFDDFIKDLPEPTTLDKLGNAFFNLERTRRGFLVSQLATSMRNILSQSARVTIGAIDDTLQGVVRGTVGGEGNPLKQAGEGLDTFIALYHRLTPSGRNKFSQIINSDQATLAKIKMLSTPVHEAIGGKTVQILNKLNTTQEHFFRKIGFESKLTQLLERKGMNIKNIDPNKIPKEMLEEAAEYSLEITFSAMPKSEFGKKFVREIAGNPIATALVNPFPRFAFGNALPYLINFSPISFLKAMNPKVVAELANGNPDKFAKNASRAILGMTQLSLASWLRNSEHRGEKWYEVKNGEKYYDVRSYAPILAPYMLISEALSHPDKLKAADWAQAAIGLNRIAGTGLVLTDVLRSKDIESTTKFFSRMAGEYLGSFSVPMKTFQDIYAGINPEAAKFKDVRESPITGPFRRNIPVVSQTLPEAVSSIKKETPRVEKPILRQLTGISEKTKTLIEKEIDHLGVEISRINPKTGIPRADRELSKYMGPVIEQIFPKILNSPGYYKSDEAKRRLILGKLFAQARLMARKKLAQDNPSLAREIKFEGLGKDIKEILGR